eukprot:SAG11_NODE_464_length_9216_cov_131.568326_6_plen_145_part_00
MAKHDTNALNHLQETILRVVILITGEPMAIEDLEGDDLPPPPNRQYKTPHALIPELQKFISEMLEKKWIEPSASEFSSPVLILTEKPNGKGYRFVVDLRQVNKRSRRDGAELLEESQQRLLNKQRLKNKTVKKSEPVPPPPPTI